MPYTPAQAAAIVGIAASSIRNYTAPSSPLRQYFSAGATPPAGVTRILDEHDLHLLKFIAAASKAHQTIEVIAQRLANGELADLPEVEPPAGAAPPPEENTPGAMLALVSAVSDALREARQSESELHARLVEQSAQLAAARATIQQQAERIAYLESLHREEVERLRTEVERKRPWWNPFRRRG